MFWFFFFLSHLVGGWQDIKTVSCNQFEALRLKGVSEEIIQHQIS